MIERPQTAWWTRAFSALCAQAPAYFQAKRVTEVGYLTAERGCLNDPAIRAKADTLALDMLQAQYDAEDSRRRTIEEKARANLLAITIGLTILVGGPASLVEQLHSSAATTWVPLPVFVLLFAAASYFLWAGYMALEAIRLRQWYVLTLEEALEPLERRKERLWWYVDLNQRATLLRSNALEASFSGIRCGMTALGILLVWVTIVALAAPPRRPEAEVATQVRQTAQVPGDSLTTRGPAGTLIVLERPAGGLNVWHIDRIQGGGRSGGDLGKVLLGGLLAILGGFAVQGYRGRQEEGRAKRRLMLRIRSALETAASVARSSNKKDEKHEINPEVMQAVIIEWKRYDRVADDLNLLKDPRMEEAVDAVLGHARMVAEKIIEDERRFKITARETGETTPAGIKVESAILEGIWRQRRRLLELLASTGERCQSALDEINARWRPSAWHSARHVPDAVESAEPTDGN